MDPARALGEQGLSEALDRLRDRLATGGWYQGPFTESLFWIVALKDLHGNSVDYTTAQGQTLKALGWARNYAAHELLNLSTVNMTTSGVRGLGVRGLSIRGGGGHLMWVHEASLPVRGDERDRRALYEALVAGRGPVEPLEATAAYLFSLP